MKEKQYTQLLSTATSLHTAATFIQTQIVAFEIKCNMHCAEITRSLDTIDANAKTLLLLSPNLNEENFALLKRLKTTIDQLQDDLNKNISKPLAVYAKEIAKCLAQLANKVTPHLTEPCEFDLNRVRTLAEETRAALIKSEHVLNKCLAVSKLCQTQLIVLDDTLQRLDLPNFIKLATKEAEHTAKHLQQLNAHLASMSLEEQPCRTEFLPLRKAVEGLGIQSGRLLESVPIAPSSSASPSAPRPTS